MRNQSQNERFVNTIANNVGYINKTLAVQQICQFIRYNQSFNPYQGFRSNGPDSYFSFVELIGFMQIGGILTKTYIGVPKNYPNVPPIFLLNFNPQVHEINDYNRLMSSQIISIQKNEFNESYIKLRIPGLTHQWVPKKSLLQIYGQVEKIINSPPIIFLKKSYQDKLRSSNRVQQRKAISKIENKALQQIMDKMNIDMSELNSHYQKVIDHRQQLQYAKCRNEFIAGYIPQITNQLQLKTKQITKNINYLNQTYNKSITDNSCLEYLDISEKDRERVELMSEQQSLKQAQAAVRSKIQKSKEQHNKYGEYKKIVKSLYDRMFENKTKMINLNQ